MYSGIHLDIKNIIVFLHTLSAYRIIAYSSAAMFTRLIPGNVCVQAEGMLKPMKTLVLIQHRKNPIKNKIIILNCQPPLLGENYTEIKAWQLKFP